MAPHSPDVAPSPEWSRVIEQERDRAFAEKAAKKAEKALQKERDRKRKQLEQQRKDDEREERQIRKYMDALIKERERRNAKFPTVLPDASVDAYKIQGPFALRIQCPEIIGIQDYGRSRLGWLHRRQRYRIRTGTGDFV